jgi:hypothetical protein
VLAHVFNPRSKALESEAVFDGASLNIMKFKMTISRASHSQSTIQAFDDEQRTVQQAPT